MKESEIVERIKKTAQQGLGFWRVMAVDFISRVRRGVGRTLSPEEKMAVQRSFRKFTEHLADQEDLWVDDLVSELKGDSTDRIPGIREEERP